MPPFNVVVPPTPVIEIAPSAPLTPVPILPEKVAPPVPEVVVNVRAVPSRSMVDANVRRLLVVVKVTLAPSVIAL